MSKRAIIYKNYESEVECLEGQVKWYKPEKGYGFLIPDDNSEDIFVHFSVLDAAGCQLVEAGDRIVCEIGPGKKGRQVNRIVEVKFAPGRSKDFSDIGPRSLASYLESLEEIEGEIKWFNPMKRYGFVTPYQGGEIFSYKQMFYVEQDMCLLSQGPASLSKFLHLNEDLRRG